jgi:hypothetical protein
MLYRANNELTITITIIGVTMNFKLVTILFLALGLSACGGESSQGAAEDAACDAAGESQGILESAGSAAGGLLEDAQDVAGDAMEGAGDLADDAGDMAADAMDAVGDVAEDLGEEGESVLGVLDD